MSLTRRELLVGTGAAVASAAVAAATGGVAGCAPSVRAPRERSIGLVLDGLHTVDGAGVRLTRLLGQSALRHLDPFVLLDRFHSANPDDYAAGFPDHPHRGFETVTIMLAGGVRHHDSVGNAGTIVGGGAQWMTAGHGIVHSEMPVVQPGLLSGFQLWINLPRREKLCAPVYQDLAPERIADGVAVGKGRVRVIAGDHDGLAGPVRPRATEPLLLTAALDDERPLVVRTPPGHAGMLNVAGGAIAVGRDGSTRRVEEGQLAVLEPGDRVTLRAVDRASELLLVAARPLGEPIAQRGPFVMSTERELDQAFADWRAGVLTRG